MKTRRSHIVALSGISSALSIISIVLACYVEPLTISLMVLSGIFLMLPLTKGYWIGSVIGYVVSSVASFFIVNINALPFILFFGLYVPLQWILDFKLFNKPSNKWLRLILFWIIKIAFFEVVVCACWYLMQTIIADMHIFGQSITYLIISLGLLPLFVLYDILMHCVYVNVKRIVDSKIIDTKSADCDDAEILRDNLPFSDISNTDITDTNDNSNTCDNNDCDNCECGKETESNDNVSDIDNKESD